MNLLFLYVGLFASMFSISYFLSIELAHAPDIHAVELSQDNMQDVHVSWMPSFDGNTPIIGFKIEFREVPPGM